MGAIYSITASTGYITSTYNNIVAQATQAQIDNSMRLHNEGFRVSNISIPWSRSGGVACTSDCQFALYKSNEYSKAFTYLVKVSQPAIFMVGGYQVSNVDTIYGYYSFCYNIGPDNPEAGPEYFDFESIDISYYDTKEEAYEALGFNIPITYRDTNCVHNGPTEANAGSTVNVTYTFPNGYGIANNSDIYVTNNGVIIPSTYANGALTFTMPE